MLSSGFYTQVIENHSVFGGLVLGWVDQDFDYEGSLPL